MQKVGHFVLDCPRLSHSPSPVAVSLSVGYRTWPPIGWYHPFVNSFFLNIEWLELSQSKCIMGSHKPWGFPSFFQCAVLKCPPLGSARVLWKSSSLSRGHVVIYGSLAVKCCERTVAPNTIINSPAQLLCHHPEGMLPWGKGHGQRY